MAKGIIKDGGTVAPPYVAPPPKGGGVGASPSPSPTPPPAPPSPAPPAGPAGNAVLQAINFAGMKVGYFKYDSTYEDMKVFIRVVELNDCRV